VQIPVERTIGDTYRFAFANILSIFGIAWLPFLIMFAVCVAAVLLLLPDLNAIDWSRQSDLGLGHDAAMHLGFRILHVLPPIYVLGYLLIAIVTVGVQRKALGLHECPVFVFFSFGSEVWRLLGAIIFVLILLIMNGAVTAGVVAFLFGAGATLPSAFGLVEFVAVIAGICWFFYAAVRLTFFIPPAVVMEGGLGIARSWQLGRGNFWRIFVLFVACVMGPAIVISTVGNIIFMPFIGEAMMRLQQATEAHRVLSPQEMWSMIGPALKNFLPYWIAYEVVTYPILIGLSNAVSACAYRNVTRSEVPA
jgi:hypothetical protein